MTQMDKSREWSTVHNLVLMDLDLEGSNEHKPAADPNGWVHCLQKEREDLDVLVG